MSLNERVDTFRLQLPHCHGVVLRRTEDASYSLFHNAVVDALDHLGIAYPREIHALIKSEVGYDGTRSSIFGVLTTLRDEGDVHHRTNGAYFLSGDDRPRQPMQFILPIRSSTHFQKLESSFYNHLQRRQ